MNKTNQSNIYTELTLDWVLKPKNFLVKHRDLRQHHLAVENRAHLLLLVEFWWRKLVSDVDLNVFIAVLHVVRLGFTVGVKENSVFSSVCSTSLSFAGSQFCTFLWIKHGFHFLNRNQKKLNQCYLLKTQIHPCLGYFLLVQNHQQVEWCTHNRPVQQ